MLSKLPGAVQDGLLHAVAYATSNVFVWAIPIAIVVPLLAWFIKEVPLRGSSAPATPAAAPAAEAPLAEISV
jgi:hypothetical protein